MSVANNITFAQAKTSLLYRPTINIRYNTLYRAGKEVCKKDEKFLVLFDFYMKLLYGRHLKIGFFFYLEMWDRRRESLFVTR